ncbi:VanZ family protein [Actinoplanes sp. NEAU-A12]|uniref:VanZ family protein n=1 Tax=Actinoplanes sandaracinus TaxID=3045177 RepID=A0ABT6WLE6_9ACTN|nr:VanZ family protein [Actinoplanes sandaracinus]MDI6100549.1 VanZ family protein [Actinoplanes sandaracinus]
MLTLDMVLAVISQPALMTILAISAGLAWPLGRRARPDRPRLGALFVFTLGAVLSATAITVSWRPSPVLIPSYLDGFGDPAYLVGEFAGSREKIANIGLFLPLGLLAGLLWRRPAAILGLLAALTFTIELWQAFIGRGGDAVDVVHNTVGALLGLMLAGLPTRLRPGRLPSP